MNQALAEKYKTQLGGLLQQKNGIPPYSDPLKKHNEGWESMNKISTERQILNKVEALIEQITNLDAKLNQVIALMIDILKKED